jgi:hypothetical protein
MLQLSFEKMGAISNGPRPTNHGGDGHLIRHYWYTRVGDFKSDKLNLAWGIMMTALKPYNHIEPFPAIMQLSEAPP